MSQSPTEAGAAPASALRYQQGWKALNRLLHEDRSFSGGERNCAWLNCAGKGFADISAVSGFDFPDDARAVTAVDWDFDGDLDLWLTCRTAPRVRLLQNRAAAGEWVALDLRGDGKAVNRDAIGARAEIWLEGQTHPLIRTVHGGDSFLSQTSRWLHFGLGQGAKIARVVVRWPGQPAGEVTGVEPGRFYQITMGAAAAARWTPPSTLQPLVASAQTPLPDEETARIVLPSRLPLPSLPGLRDVKGPLLINLWSATCSTCNHELAAWAEEFAVLRDAGLNLLALNADRMAPEPRTYPFETGHADPAALRGFDLFQRSVLDRWMPLPVPTSFLLDREGRVAVIYKGSVAAAQLALDARLLDATPEAWRAAALPFPGRFLNPPPPPSPDRLATQFVDANLLNEALQYLESWVARQKATPAITETIQTLRAAVRPDPGPALLAKADALRDKGDTKAAVTAYQDTLRQSPRTFAAAEHLAWILASHADPTLHSPAEARGLAERLCAISQRKNPAWLDLLGAAQAANGDFPAAILTAREALGLLGESPAAAAVRSRLALYEAGTPWVTP